MPRVLASTATLVVLAITSIGIIHLSWTSQNAQLAGEGLISVDGATRFQRIDGFGVNANPKNWAFSNLAPPIDLLVDDLHASLWRVDIDGNSNWIDDPSQLNASYYGVIYETSDFQALWQTLSYLNARGASVVLSATGVVPRWMGSTFIAADHEDQFVEMICSVVDYGRRVRGIPILMLSPLNETDIGAPEGPLVAPDQYARLLNKIRARLHQLGYDDVRLVAPEIANVDAAARYLDPIFQDPTLMGQIDHFGFHNYFGSSGTIGDVLAASAYPDRTFWMTEWSEASTDGFLDNGHAVEDEWQFAQTMTDELLSLLEQGPTAALAWDAWDNVHEHCRCNALSHWGLLALAPSTNTYQPRKRYYTNAQVFKFVPPGWSRVDASGTSADLRAVAFANPAGTQWTLVGHNTSSASTTLHVSLQNLELPSSLGLWITNTNEDLVQSPVDGTTPAALSMAIPADSFFTLTTL